MLSPMATHPLPHSEAAVGAAVAAVAVVDPHVAIRADHERVGRLYACTGFGVERFLALVGPLIRHAARELVALPANPAQGTPGGSLFALSLEAARRAALAAQFSALPRAGTSQALIPARRAALQLDAVAHAFALGAAAAACFDVSAGPRGPRWDPQVSDLTAWAHTRRLAVCIAHRSPTAPDPSAMHAIVRRQGVPTVDPDRVVAHLTDRPSSAAPAERSRRGALDIALEAWRPLRRRAFPVERDETGNAFDRLVERDESHNPHGGQGDSCEPRSGQDNPYEVRGRRGNSFDVPDAGGQSYDPRSVQGAVVGAHRMVACEPGARDHWADRLQAAIAELVRSGRWTSHKRIGRVFVAREGCFLLWPLAARDLLDQLGIVPIRSESRPEDIIALEAAMIAAGAIEPVARGRTDAALHRLRLIGQTREYHAVKWLANVLLQGGSLQGPMGIGRLNAELLAEHTAAAGPGYMWPVEGDPDAQARLA